MIRIRTPLTIVFLALLLWIAWQIVYLRTQKPLAYQGTPLSVWLQDYEFGKQSPGTDKALRAMGTHALPTLMRMLRAKDSPLRLRLLTLAQKQHWVQFHHTPAETLHMRAVLAFHALGAKGKSVVPELIKMYKQAPADGPWAPGAVLAGIGPDASAAIPALLANVTNVNQGARELSVAALGRIHAEPELVIPVLIKALADVSPVRYQAVIGLGLYGKVATNAGPALLDLIKNPTSNHRGNIARALDEIGVPPEAVVA
ncbi:MAG: HEAT repeat domain-containing protein, partial [Candidatus Dormibacteraceae bacterium]